jgi:hypothetical protein
MTDRPNAANAARSCVSAVDRTNRIRELNDAFRTTLSGGRVMLTASVSALGSARVALLLQRVRSFSDFSSDNDPHQEHDFGAFEDSGERLFWKIDYYDRHLEAGSPDPSDSSVTTRVLTLMLAEDY